ncbi:PREDICTED: uncharacterized protein LOC104773423 [Camelina sativa]|uniref:Uncharacterized protein LOC104773423 n=1 Tax=Camelina sativa TaxID=90675 RepID=A0ABM0Y6K3_CAMSA|nr:PREDICTED: uncharacterized protein LOC104773423 [Camelina sativa]
MMKPPTEEAAAAPVCVYWDIKRCPVPDGYDPRRVGPCIKRYLRNLGYSGPITITAVGELSKVRRDILEVATTTGISLLNDVHGPRDMVDLFLDCLGEGPTPSNLMVISSPPAYVPPNFSSLCCGKNGYYGIFPFPFESTPEAAESLWKHSLLDLAGVCLLNATTYHGESEEATKGLFLII